MNTQKKPSPKKDLAKRRNNRTTFIGVVFCLALVALCVVIGYIQFQSGEEYTLRAVSHLVTARSNVEEETVPNRGDILDRNRQPLAESIKVYSVYLDVVKADIRVPYTFSDGTVLDYKAQTLTALNEVLGVPMEELEAYFAHNPDGSLVKPNYWQIVARQVSASKAMQLEEMKLFDVYLRDESQRVYRDPMLAPQTLGFLRGPNSWGIENSYNAELTGEAGRIYRSYDQDNNPVTNDIPARDGYTVISTIDSEFNRIIQRVVEEQAAQVPCEYAAMLIMQPYTGEILAMAQTPSFSLADPSNPEFFTDTTVKTFWEAMSVEEKAARMEMAWGNFHTLRTFEPGSIFKPMVIAAALEENIIDPSSYSVFCGGKVQVYDWPIPCWNINGHGSENLRDVLVNSCNIGMVNIASLLGRDLFYKYRVDFGYADTTDIDLPYEEDASSVFIMPPYAGLGPVELATSGMGQGFSNTALQAITAFSAVINGGNLMKPYVVSQIVDENGTVVKENRPTVVRKVISQGISDYVRETMQAVVDSGTGTSARVDGYTIGGKTGSGQQGDRDGDIMTYSFMAFTPVENPEYVMLAVLDRVPDPDLGGGQTVGPMIKKAMEAIIEYKNMRPTSETQIAANSTEDLLPDYRGMNIVEVTQNLNNRGLDYHVITAGTVVKNTQPPGGSAQPKTSPVFLYMDPETRIDGQMVAVPDVQELPMDQAMAYLADAGLNGMPFIDGNDKAGSAEGFPTTYNVGASEGEGASGQEETPEADSAVIYNVYKQFPSPGVLLQQGAQVKLKVRP
jgi:stage V sporulation protein D (sporulation-specific penicillin-binding protein)